MKKQITLALKWLLLLTKRLCKKPAFIVILVLIPILSLAMSRASEEDNGLLTVTVATDGERDTVAEEVMSSFEKKDSAVLFKVMESPEAAKTEVERGRADAAWIIPGELEDALVEYCRYSDEIVTVYEREETSFMALSREIMYSKLFPYISRIYSEEYAEDWLSPTGEYSKEEFLEFYNKMRPGEDESFIEFKALGGIGETNTTESNHLKMPIRGLLATLVVLCGLASAMTVSEDMEKGTFSWLEERRHIWVYHASNAGACIVASAVSVVSLVFAKMAGNILYEALTAFLFALCCALFCTFIATVMRSSRRIAASVPPVVILILAFSSVFIRLSDTPFQYILPTYSYIYSSVELSYMWIMCIYIAVGTVLCSAVDYAITIFVKKAHFFQKKQ